MASGIRQPGMRASRATLVVTGVLSVALHVGAAYAIGLFPDRLEAPEAHDADGGTPLAPEHPWMMLGEEDGSPVSLSWITLEEPTPNAAVDPSEVVQPLLRIEASAPSPGEPNARTGPGDALQQVDAEAVRRALSELRRVREVSAEIVNDQVRALVATPALVASLLAHERPGEAEQETPAVEAPAIVEQATAQQAGGGAPDPGPQATISYREADPSSVVEALAIVVGSDEPGKGITITTLKPLHSPYVQIVSSPRPAIFDIEWDEEGRGFPVVVQSSGSSAVDQNYLNVISRRWGAKGPAIDRLKSTAAEDRVMVRLRVLF